ncbi:MAG: ribosome biogenesis GTPase Der [Phycisphaeraceae bacterium]|nr:ribosome biogenesis GTPase Der [Phycisphaeraceae bacterium]
MPIPRIAIVGRPNVGKSSLLNLIAGERVSIVDDTPGVTRDRVATLVRLPSPRGEGERLIEVIDTGGFGAYVAEGRRFDEVGNDLARLTPEIERQISEAIGEADLVLFAVDAQAGILPVDLEIARMLREGKLGGTRPERPPIRVIATKVDGPKWEAHAYEIAALGFGEPLMCSATTSYMRRDMLDQLFDLLPEGEDGEDPRVGSADLKIAIVGKRNAGKSSLINTLAGQERVIVSEIPGTTRDSIDVRFEVGERSVVAIDTAGLRRKKSFQDRVEWYAYDRLQRAIERADVVVMMIDATEDVSQVDEQLGQLICDSWKPCVIAVNKWDLVEGRIGRDGREISPEHYEKYLHQELKGLVHAPIAFISAARGDNLMGLLGVCAELKEQAALRVGTGKLNRLVRDILEQRGPSSKLGTRVKVLYAAQVSVSPPTIVLVVNHPELFTDNYRRYLLNRFREALPFEEVPIRLVIRARRQREGDLAAEAERERYEPELVDILRQMPEDPEAYFED